MAGRKFSLSQYLHERTAEIEPLFAFQARSEPEARKWRARALAKARDLLGEQPQFAPLDPEIISTAETEFGRCEHVIFDADLHSSVPSLLFIPKSLAEPAPAVICLHDTGYSKDECDHARELAKQGYVTLAFDLRGHGERQAAHYAESGLESCDGLCSRASLLGVSILALHVHDTVKAVEYLQTRPEVDERRIGCTGLGLGGLVTMWTAGTDRNIKATVVAGCLHGLDDLTSQRDSQPESACLPALRRYFDLCDIAALIAPRSMMIQSAAEDPLIPLESAKRAYLGLAAAYTTWGAPNAVTHHVFAGGRRINTQAAADWLRRKL